MLDQRAGWIKKRKRSVKDESELPASKALVTEDTDFEPHAATLDFIRGYHNSVVGHVGVRATMQRINMHLSRDIFKVFRQTWKLM